VGKINDGEFDGRKRLLSKIIGNKNRSPAILQAVALMEVCPDLGWEVFLIFGVDAL
jgi:hypothetical protein